MKKRALSLFLALILCLSLLPAAVFAVENVFTLGTTRHYDDSQGTLTDEIWEARLGTFTPTETGYYRVRFHVLAADELASYMLRLYSSSGTALYYLRQAATVSVDKLEMNSVGIWHLEAGEPAILRSTVVGIDGDVPSFNLDVTVYKVADDHILTSPQNGSYQLPTYIEEDGTGANICVIPYRVDADGYYISTLSAEIYIQLDSTDYGYYWGGGSNPVYLKATDSPLITVEPHAHREENFSMQSFEVPELSLGQALSINDGAFSYARFTPEKSGKYTFAAEMPESAPAWSICDISIQDGYSACDVPEYANEKHLYTQSARLDKDVQYLIRVFRGASDDNDTPYTLRVRQDLTLADADVLTEANRYGLLRYAHFESAGEPLTRLDVVKLLTKAMNLTVDRSNTELSFSDCDALSLEEKALMKACLDAGVINRYVEDNTFRPNTLVTKSQLAVVIVRALGLENTDVEGDATYADMDGHWAADYVNKLLNLQIAPQAANFGPEQTATRQDALELLVRACYGGYCDAIYNGQLEFRESPYTVSIGETLDFGRLIFFTNPREWSDSMFFCESSDESVLNAEGQALKPGTVTLYAYLNSGTFTKTTATVTGTDFSITAKDAAYTGLAYDTANITKTSNVETAPTYTYYADNNGAKGEALEAAPVNAGTYWVEGAIAVGAATVTSAPVKFRITKAPLTITAKDHTITYGEAPANDGVGYTGFVNGEDAAVVSGLDYTYNYEQYGNAGSYAITPTSAAADNYQITMRPGKLTVAQKAVGLTWSGYESLYYDGQAKAVTAAATGLVNDDAVTVTVAGGAQKDAGSYTAKAAGLTGAKAANYKLPDAGLTQAYTIAYALERVTAAPATVTATVDQSTRTIRLVGYIGAEEEIGLDGLTIEDGKVTVHGVEYTVDDTGVVVNESNATLAEATPEITKPEDADESVTDEVVTAINDAATGSEGLGNAGAEYIFGEADKDGTIAAVEVSLSIQPKALTEISLKLEIKPVVTYKDSEAEVIRTETMPNSAVKAPVTISVKLPAGMPDTGLVAKHSLGGGKFEYLSVTVTAGVASWQQSSFSETELISDSRSATVNFTFDDGSGQSITYTVADIGKALPTDSRSGSSFQGWEIDGDTTAQTVLTDALLTALDGRIVQAAPAFQSNVVWVPSTAKPETPTNSFSDVFASDYYYDAVLWAVKQNITAGVSETSFAPDAACTRAQAVTFLWRAAGEPKAVNAANPFADVTETDYYYDAVLWAVEQGITAGVSETRFAPGDTVTRAQMMTFLWRAAGTPAGDGEPGFTDVDAEAWYAEAVAWAVDKGLTQGVSATSFAPDDNCTRAQIVTFLYRNMGK